jgi:large subunit ribosomal protein L10
VALSRNEKAVILDEVSQKVATAQTVVLAEYRGIAVDDLTRLRKKSRESGVYLRVIKNTLVHRAVSGTKFEALAPQMVGPLIYGMSEDPIAAAKVLNDFAKTNDKLVLRAGAYNDRLMDKVAVQALASIPSRDELLSKLLFVMQAPVSGFARCLGALAEKNQTESV